MENHSSYLLWTPTPLWERVKAFCAERKVKLADFVRAAIEEYLSRHENEVY